MTIAAEACRKLTPIDPVETGVLPRLPKLPDIEAVAFDIYGTLLISAAGDISLANETVSADAMEGLLCDLGERGEGASPEQMAEAYHDSIERRLQLRRDEGISHPEVEIREVWQDVFQLVRIEGISASELERLSITYECVVNPVWLMPGALELLASLSEGGLPLGIISNAQFYTQPIFEELSGLSLTGLGFEESLSHWSFEVGEGKPSRKLYEQLADSCQERNIDVGRVLYVGNDLQKDVIPAREVGFLTGLFAGDKRSLRVGEVPLKKAESLADAVITDLKQIRDVVKIK